MAQVQWSLTQFPNLPDNVEPSVRDAIQLLFKGLKDHSDAFTYISPQIKALQQSVGQTTTVQSSGVAGVLAGGTGTQSLASNGVLIGQGANPVQAVLPGAAGDQFTSNGSGINPSFQSPLVYEVLVDETGTPINATLSASQVDCLMVRHR